MASLSKLVGTVVLGAKRHSPELLFVCGTVSGVAALILTAKGTPKAIAAREKYKNEKQYILDAKDIGETAIGEKYTDEDFDKDNKINTSKYIVDTVRAYLPAAACASISFCCYLASFGIMSKRLASAVTLLTTTSEAFEQYRKRVVADQGENKDYEYLTGATSEKVKEQIIDEETGKKKTVTQSIWCLDPGINDIPFLSPYAITITPDHRIWKNNGGNPMLMQAQLKIIQNNLTKLLHMRGLLTLEDVLYGDNGLGFDPRDKRYDFNPNYTKCIGWLDTKNEGKDRFINFGCWGADGNLNYIPGKCIILDLNCDGWIMGKMPDRLKHGQELKDACREFPEIEK